MLGRVRVAGHSMEPALHHGDELLFIRVPPRIGSVVVARDPRDDDRLVVKRVAAMDGDGANHHRLEIGAKGDDTGDVEVYVKDNGPGVPPDIVDRLFEPFFTTKTDGLGMGLSISRSIVTGHHGRIWLSSEAGGGASFRFTLPIGTGGEHDTP
ncbi:MAG: hypothetical protein HYY38_08905 [Rhodospirillales bacterium]|nr:hypothetical protein [Rhodospirillales bacterium]